jgi:hypothetical protein
MLLKSYHAALALLLRLARRQHDEALVLRHDEAAQVEFESKT